MTPENAPRVHDAVEEVPPPAPCARCGTFVVAGDVRELLGLRLCEQCASRPELAQVDAFRRRHLGRRTLGVWLVGAAAPLCALVAFDDLQRALAEGGTWRMWAAGALEVAAAVGSGAYFAGRRWARPVLFLLPFVPAAGLGETASAPVTVGLYAVALVGAVALLFRYRSVRERLFFRLEVAPGALERSWRRSAPNRIAQLAARLALGLSAATLAVLIASDPVIEKTGGRAEPYVLGSVVLLLLLIALATFLGVIGLTRYRPSATPPVGGLPSGLTALGLGGLWLAIVLVGTLG